MGLLKNIATEETKGLSDLFDGREKLDKKARKELLGTKLTIDDFDIIDYDDSSDKKQPHKHFGVVVFVEEPKIAYCTGMQLTRILDNYVSNFDSVVEARDAYAEEDKLMICMEEKETKGGNTFVAVTVVEEV